MQQWFSKTPKRALPTGEMHSPVYLNSAATTQTFEFVPEVVSKLLVRRGASGSRSHGPLGELLTAAKTEAKEELLRFVGASGRTHDAVYTSNSSDAIDRFVRMLRLGDRDVVITSQAEHTSNLLPWRLPRGPIVRRARVSLDGTLDYDQLEDLLKEHAGARRRWIALSGASTRRAQWSISVSCRAPPASTDSSCSLTPRNSPHTVLYQWERKAMMP